MGRGPPAGALSALLIELARGGAPARGDAGLRAGATVGRFEIVRELGRGGFGVVYEARDRELGGSVALKLVRADARPEVAEAQLLREADAAARLSHPNIVAIHEVGRCAHGPYLVLELLRGSALSERLRQGRIAPREALRIALEVAKGLACAHGQGVVHRDLTVGNVFLCEDGQVKVLDLGMAHAFGLLKTDGGTPGYMAPEQRRGAPEDERTDVFALGAVLYEMLAAEPLDARRLRAAPRLEIPAAPGLGDLLARMLAADPVDRPRDAGRVAVALAAFQRELERAGTGEVTVLRRRPRRSPRRVAWLAAAGVVAAGAAAYVAQRAGRGAQATTEAPPSVAVLPFVDLSPTHDQEYLSEGIAEEILATLAHVDGLRVAGRTSSFSFKGRNATAAEIGRALHVTTVLEGSVRKEGQRIRVTALLSNAADGYQRWSKRFDRDLEDVFAVEEEIASAVAGELERKLVTGSAARPTPRRTARPAAYTEYLLAKQLYLRHTADGYRRAADASERALAIDPDYAPAHAQLAMALRGLWITTADREASQAYRARARAEAERAIAQGADLPEAYTVRALVREWDHDWGGADEDLRRAIQLDPRDGSARRRHGILLAEIGRLPEAVSEVRLATELDPLDATSMLWLGVVHKASDGCAAARPFLVRTLAISPESEDAQTSLADCDVEEGRYDEALARVASLTKPDRWAITALAHRGLGNPAEAARALDVLVSRWSHNSAGAIAEYYARTGDTDRAFEWLDRSLAQEMPFLKFERPWRQLRGDPRWPALLRKVNLPPD